MTTTHTPPEGATVSAHHLTAAELAAYERGERIAVVSAYRERTGLDIWQAMDAFEHALRRLRDNAPQTAAERDRLRAVNGELVAALRGVTGWQLNDEAIAKLGFAEPSYKAAFGRARAAIAKAENVP